jgi:malonyl-CoA/methylmalonyl-CoA synthetase
MLDLTNDIRTIYMRMRRYFEKELAHLPNSEEYTRGTRQFKAALCGTSALPRPISEFWTGLMGKHIFQRYGATEFGAVFKVNLDDLNVPDGSVGVKVPGIEVKVGANDELLVKSPVSASHTLQSSNEALCPQGHMFLLNTSLPQLKY